MVYEVLQQEYPHISLGTVYRNLNLLVEQGEALRLVCGDGVDHFDGCTVPHYHLYCNQCGRVADLNMDSINHIDQIAGAGFEGEIQGHIVYFYGLCPECKRQAAGQSTVCDKVSVTVRSRAEGELNKLVDK
jgi:Fur family peroxide stress response transcriptional regulator